MAEKKTRKKTEDAPVEETAADATETTEAATPAVDEGAPMASTEAMDETTAEAEAPVDAGTAEEDAAPQPEAAEDDVEPVVEQAEETQPVAEEAAPAEEPVGEEAVAEETPAEEPVAEEAPAEAPVAEEPVAEETPAEEPAAEAEPEPVAEEAPAEEPAAEAPAAEAEPAAEPAAETPATPAPQSGPKPKRKRLPRALRPSTKKGRVKREKATERKPIVRLPKPEREFGRRQERLGTVVSDKGDKTIVVKVDTIKAHPRYKKVVRRSKRFHAHDEQNAAKIGDVVKIIETRPISKTKNWRLAEIVEVAK
jgi:ribosomal protein uS17